MYNAYIVKIDKLRKHNNADRLQIAEIFGDSIIVGLDVHIGDIGVYFPIGGQLNEKFCDENHLCRKNADGSADTGYLDRDKRNIVAIKLRGEKSEGLYLPISAFDYLGVKWSEKDVGTPITSVNGEVICQKYIPKTNQSKSGNGRISRPLISKSNIAPLFAEHADTEQLAYNLNTFKEGDLIEITCKMHGTSQRTGYLPVLVKYTHKNPIYKYLLNYYLNKEIENQKFKSFLEKIFKNAKPIYEWKYISGTRRTVLNDWGGGFYGSNAFRKQHADFFEGKLHKGETVYYEVVGFTDTGTPIMPSASNKALGKDFVRQYGETTVFSYGCYPEAKSDDNPQSDFYVYRMTMTNEDGDVVEYTPDYMRYRCEQMGAKTVPVFWKGYLNEPDDWTKETYDAGEVVKQLAEEYYDGPDPIGHSHIREGVVVRIVNRPKFTAFKHKSFSFKVLSGIAIDTIAKTDSLDSLNNDIINEM